MARESYETRRDPGGILQRVGDHNTVDLDDQRAWWQIPFAREAAVAVHRRRRLRKNPETEAVVSAQPVAGGGAAAE